MRYSAPLSFALVLLAAALVPAAQAQSSLYAEVVDEETGALIPSALIEVFGGGAVSRAVQSDTMGFVLRVEDGVHQVVGYAHGYKAGRATVRVRGERVAVRVAMARDFTAFGRIVGRLESSEGAPFPGVPLRFEGRSSVRAIDGGHVDVVYAREVRTGADGTFVLDEVVPGKHRARVEIEGYRSTDEAVIVEEGGTSDWTVALRELPSSDRTNNVTIHTLDAGTDEPIPASQALKRLDGTRAIYGGSRSSEPYRIYLEPGDYSSSVSALGYQRSATDTFTVAEDPVTLTFRLARTFRQHASLGGQILLDGQPHVGARVQAKGSMYMGNGFVQTAFFVDTTDAEGRYAFPALPPADYEVVAGTGALRRSAEITLADGQAGTVDLSAESDHPGFASFRGNVVPQKNWPRIYVEGAAVRLYEQIVTADGTLRRGPLAYEMTAGEYGRFEFAILAETTYIAEIEADGYATHTEYGIRLEANGDRLSEYELLGDGLRIVAGTVRYLLTGEPAARGFVSIADTSGRGVGYAPVGPDGTFSIRVPEATDAIYHAQARVESDSGYYALRYYFPNALSEADATLFAVRGDARLVTASGRALALDFAVPDPDRTVTTTVEGTVTDSAGVPIVGAFVGASSFEPTGRTPSGRATTGPDGSYRLTITGVYMPQLRVEAHAPGYEVTFYGHYGRFMGGDGVVPVAVPYAAEPVVTGVHLVLAEERGPHRQVIGGTVRDPDGVPIARAFVVATPARRERFDWSRWPAYALTDSSGTFSLPAANDGPHLLLFVARGYAPAYLGGARTWRRSETVEPGTTDVAMTLVPLGRRSGGSAGSVVGLVSYETGGPVAGALVVAEDAHGVALAAALTDREGRYHIDAVRAGDVTVRAEVKDTHEATAAHMLRTGETAEIDLTLRAMQQVGREPGETPVTEVALGAAYPNPFSGTTTIPFVLPEAGSIELSVYDPLGRRVAVVFSGTETAGEHTATFDADGLSSGVYLYRLQTERGQLTRRFTVLR